MFKLVMFCFLSLGLATSAIYLAVQESAVFLTGMDVWLFFIRHSLVFVPLGLAALLFGMSYQREYWR